MASTIKVTNIDTPDSTGNITVDRPLAGSGASLTALNATQLTTGTIPIARLGNDVIDSQHYVAASIDTAHIAASQITTALIADDAVTAAKIADAVALGGPSLGTSSIIRTNAKTISENITFAGTENGMTVGPITVANNYSVIVTNGSTWTIV